jgi:glycogen operon protein
VSYNEKHNEANGDENRDGESHNRSWNCGAEGDTDDAGVLALRARQKRNFMATLLLSQGIPMILHGDELGRTQRGNNNGYCQDNELSWLNWERADRELLTFTASLISLRLSHAVFRRRNYFLGRPIHGAGVTDVGWYKPDGTPMSDEDWNVTHTKFVGLFLNGSALSNVGARGEILTDDNFYLAFNADHEPVTFVIPDELNSGWTTVLDTSQPLAARIKPKRPIDAILPASDTGTSTVALDENATDKTFDAGSQFTVEARCLVILRRETPRGDPKTPEA